MLVQVVVLLTLGLFSIVRGQDSLNVTRLGSCPMPDFAHRVAISHNYAFVLDVVGLRIIDISNPASPVETGSCSTPELAMGIVADENFAYLADDSAGLRIIDASNPEDPSEVGAFDTPGRAYSVAARGNYAYVADWSHGLRIIDIANPAAPVETGSYVVPGHAWGVALSGDYACVLDGTGLWILNVRDPAFPTQTGYCFYATGGSGGVAASDSCAYVADGFHGLRIFDITDPAAPAEAGLINTPGYARDVAISGNLACVADDNHGLRAIDISISSSPTEAGFYRMPNLGSFSVAASGPLAYVAEGFGFGIYDVSAALSSPNPFILPPSAFILSAYPNPFNSSAQIRFDLPRAAFVRLNVYDLNGRLVEVLASRTFAAGTHRAVFDGSGKASGMYVVKLTSERSSAAQRVVLVK